MCLFVVYATFFLPVQETPFPEYPSLQAQLKDPTVLLHCALVSQSSVESVQSSTSKIKYQEYNSTKKRVYLETPLA